METRLEELLPIIDQGFIDTTGTIPVVVEGVLRALSVGDHVSKPSVHEAHELTYMRKGKIQYNIKGKTYVIPEGHAIVVKPRRAHTYSVLDGPAEIIVVYFGFAAKNTEGGTTPKISNASIEQFFSFVNGDAEKTDKEEFSGDAMMVQGRYGQSVASLVERILGERNEDNFAGSLMQRCLAIELVIEVTRSMKDSWERSLRIKEGKARELVLIARDYIMANYNKDISVADAANYVFLSQGYFARAFRDETGMSPMAFLIKVRVEKSCELLSHRDLKVSSIASRVGFSSPQRFNAAFRKQMGMTPMEYRRKLP
ncbi:MAG: helix-turn-helix domain-containing protein [Oscillospiraceae bacterium]|nr:helix-turn-helix domain-containing protein [Oscillospiraceae bacterium]MDD4367891.1 helix-turn-helix domain-containing protein [Oscillospiraceae bacterium]